MKFTPSQLHSLLTDLEFNKSVTNDEKLNRLFGEKDMDEDQQRNELLSFLGGRLTYRQSGGLEIGGMISPGVISVLHALKSPFLDTKLPVRVIDVDNAFYAFSNGKEAAVHLHDEKVYQEAAHASCDLIQLDRVEACDFLRKSVNHNFSPLHYLPDTQLSKSGTPVFFDALWLVNLISAVHAVSGKSIDEVTWDMNMVQCFFFYLQHLKNSGHKGIARRTKSQQTLDRLDELMKARIAEMRYV